MKTASFAASAAFCSGSADWAIRRRSQLLLTVNLALPPNAMPPFRRSKKQLRIIDADSEIAQSNLNRQVLFSNRALGGSKAQVAASVLQGIDPQGVYTSEVRRIESDSDLELAGRGLFACHARQRRGPIDCSGRGMKKGVVMGAVATAQRQVMPWCSNRIGVVSAARSLWINRGVNWDSESLGSAAEEDAIIATNMVVAGVAVSELREAMASRPATNLQFHATNVIGNCLARKASPADCMHRRQVGAGDCSMAATNNI